MKYYIYFNWFQSIQFFLFFLLDEEKNIYFTWKNRLSKLLRAAAAAAAVV